MRNSKVANVNVSLKSLFFRWLEITKPFHKLSLQQYKLLSLLLYYHYEYSKDIHNETLLWKMVFDYDTKLKIRNELNIKDQHLQNLLSALRKKNIIKNNTIVSTYIPELEHGSNNFKVIFNFNILDGK